jgi:hypothetical protein
MGVPWNVPSPYCRHYLSALTRRNGIARRRLALSGITTIGTATIRALVCDAIETSPFAQRGKQ